MRAGRRSASIASTSGARSGRRPQPIIPAIRRGAMGADPNDPSPKVDPSPKIDLDRRRVPLERKISLKFKEFRGFITEYSQNLSMGGMFIRTTSPKAPGTVFDF